MWMGIKAIPRPQEFYRDPGFEIHWSATGYKSDVSRYGLMTHTGWKEAPWPSELELSSCFIKKKVHWEIKYLCQGCVYDVQLKLTDFSGG